MKIGLNLLHARPAIGGGWNYIANVVNTLQLLDTDCEYLAYCTRVSAEIVPANPRFKVKIVDSINDNQSNRVLYEQVILPFVARKDKIDCFHWFANNMPITRGIRSAVTIHDFKFMDRPSESPGIKGLYLRQMARFACRNADSLIAVSKVTAEAAINLFGASKNRIFVVSNPVDETFRQASPELMSGLLKRFRLPEQFWLYVSHPYPHKNHERLFSAYKMFRESTGIQWPLVLRGDRDKASPSLSELPAQLGIADSVVWLPRLSTQDMAILYSAATAMLFPSLYEGGGIPVHEAMSCGCPVIASDINTTREFAGDAALMFDPLNVDDMVSKMRLFAVDQGLRQSCSAKGLTKAKEFSPANVARNLRAAYENAVKRPMNTSAQATKEHSVIGGI